MVGAEVVVRTADDNDNDNDNAFLTICQFDTNCFTSAVTTCTHPFALVERSRGWGSIDPIFPGTFTKAQS